MVRRARRGGRRGGFGFGGGMSIPAAMEGVGAAAVGERLIGQPLGAFTGAAFGLGYGMLMKKNLLMSGLGGAGYDFAIKGQAGAVNVGTLFG